MTSENNFSLTAAISAILFASTAPVETAKLASSLDISAEKVKEAVKEIEKSLEKTDLGIRVKEVDGRYTLSTKPEYGETVAAYLDSRRAAFLSNAALEALAITAYNQPVTKAYISQVRGVYSAEVVESLVDKGLLQEAGRLDLPGRPMSYITTDKFLTVFGLDSIEDLPEREALSSDDTETGEYVQTNLTENV
ncbi:MAG: SMC-Scp complex subunit ScpB [Clostridia bacterium]|nr:SMC-Scp complex subunit ScpB [Clostridia bacterium]